ncbi:MAG TPA: cbb3-type cytochrome c oxidase N-terminal domain-containing protein [bacterium]
MAKERDELLAHDYDGIKEYDNPLPRWWLWLFIGCIAFAVIYFPYIVTGLGPSSIEEYQREMAAAKTAAPVANAPATSNEHKDGQAHPAPPAAGPSLQGNAAAIAAGKEVFTANCAPCHGPQGQGIIGPNLTDNFWIHGNTYDAIVSTITNGVPDKGMIAWKAALNPEKIGQVAAYVISIKGSNPPNPKPPQGVEYK